MPFNDLNPASFFQQGPFPGQADFYRALQYYMGQIRGPQGRGPGQLAESGAMDQGAAGWYAPPPNVDPGGGDAQALATGRVGNLSNNAGAARTAGTAATNANQTSAAGGVENVAGAYGQDIWNTLNAESRLKAAESAQNSGLLSDIMAGIQIAGGIGSEFVAPGNPMGAQSAMSGIGHFTGGGGPGAGSGNLMSSMFSKFGSGSGNPDTPPNLPRGYTVGSGNFSPNTLPPGIDPSQIAAYSPSNDPMASGSFMDMLSNIGSWF